MSIMSIIGFSYVVSATLFILGLKLLGSPATARKGNALSAIGMLIAVVVTLLDQGIVDFRYIAIAITVGGLIGLWAARSVAMTSMPEMVALLNGFGGVASLLVGWAAITPDASNLVLITIFLSILIGGVTFTGSIVAYGKLSEKLVGRAIMFKGQAIVNSLVIAAIQSLLASSFTIP